MAARPSKQKIHDSQVRAMYRRVTKNSCMGIDQAAFVAAHFGIDPSTLRKRFRASSAETKSEYLSEDQFVDVLKSLSEIRPSSSLQIRLSIADVIKNEAVLHKSFSLPHIPAAKSPCPETPTSVKIPALSIQLPSADKGDQQSRPGSRRCSSVPLEGGCQRPRTAAFMDLFTPRGQHFQGIYGPKRWALVDSNVPKNVRAALLKPPQSLPSPLNSARSTSSQLAPALSTIAMRVMDAAKNHTRVELLRAIESAESEAERPGVAPWPAAASSAPLVAVERGFHLLGIALPDGALRELAQELDCLADDGTVRHHQLIRALISPAQVLRAEEAGIEPNKYANLKRQRLRFTDTLSTNEIRLLSILREKLAPCCGSAKQLRDTFRRFDPASTGRLRLRGLVDALAALGIAVPPADAEVLHTILDPHGRDGVDYNELTALLMPPDRRDVDGCTVAMGNDPRMSRSRRGLTLQMERERLPSRPSPAEAVRFTRRLTTLQILQVLRNQVASAMRHGPQALRELFELFDSDGDERISRAELRHVLVDFGLALTDKQVSSLLSAMDLDEDGFVDQNEFIRALLPSQHFSIGLSDRDLTDPLQCGVARRSGRVDSGDLRALLNSRIADVLARHPAAAATAVSASGRGGGSGSGAGIGGGARLREALAHFDITRDGTVGAGELRKTLLSMGVLVDDRSVRAILKCYDKDGRGRADMVALVEGVDQDAYAFAFSAGRVARAGTIATVDKEARIPPGATNAEIRGRLMAVLQSKARVDDSRLLVRAIRPYARRDGTLGEKEFRLAMLRLGLKIEDPDNLHRAYDAFRPTPNAPLDVFHLSSSLVKASSFEDSGEVDGSQVDKSLLVEQATPALSAGLFRTPSRAASTGGTILAVVQPIPMDQRTSPSRAGLGTNLTLAVQPVTIPTARVQPQKSSQADSNATAPVAVVSSSAPRAQSVPRIVTPAPFRVPTSTAA